MLAKYNCNIFRKQDGRTIATNEERQKAHGKNKRRTDQKS